MICFRDRRYVCPFLFLFIMEKLRKYLKNLSALKYKQDWEWLYEDADETVKSIYGDNVMYRSCEGSMQTNLAEYKVKIDYITDGTEEQNDWAYKRIAHIFAHDFLLDTDWIKKFHKTFIDDADEILYPEVKSKIISTNSNGVATKITYIEGLPIVKATVAIENNAVIWSSLHIVEIYNDNIKESLSKYPEYVALHYITAVNRNSVSNSDRALKYYYHIGESLPKREYIIKFDNVTVTNENNVSHEISKLLVKFTINYGYKLTSRVGGFRTKFTEAEMGSHYVHSHLPGFSPNVWEYEGEVNPFEFAYNDFCVGTGSFCNAVNALYDPDCSHFTVDLQESQASIRPLDFQVFVEMLKDFVATESLTGGPYSRIQNIVNSHTKTESIKFIDNVKMVCTTSSVKILTDCTNGALLRAVGLGVHTDSWSWYERGKEETKIVQLLLKQTVINFLRLPDVMFKIGLHTKICGNMLDLHIKLSKCFIKAVKDKYPAYAEGVFTTLFHYGVIDLVSLDEHGAPIRIKTDADMSEHEKIMNNYNKKWWYDFNGTKEYFEVEEEKVDETKAILLNQEMASILLSGIESYTKLHYLNSL